MELRPKYSVTICPKCAWGPVLYGIGADRYHDATVQVRYHAAVKYDNISYNEPEYLRISCTRCGYGWSEPTYEQWMQPAALPAPAEPCLSLELFLKPRSGGVQVHHNVLVPCWDGLDTQVGVLPLTKQWTSWNGLKAAQAGVVVEELEPVAVESATWQEETSKELDAITTALDPDPLEAPASEPAVVDGKLAWVTPTKVVKRRWWAKPAALLDKVLGATICAPSSRML